MPTKTLQAVSTGTKHIYLFHGEDSYSAYQKADDWFKKSEEKYGDFNNHRLDGEDFTAADFNEAVETMPFLSEKKLVLLRNFLSNASADDLRKVAEKLEHVGDHCVIIFLERERADARTALYKAIKKHGTVQEFGSLDAPALTNWILQNFSQTAPIAEAPSIDRSAAQSLAETVGPNLWQMVHELEKLSLYTASPAVGNTISAGASAPPSGGSGATPSPTSARPITQDDIEALVSPNPIATVFKLTNSLATKNAKAALRTLETLTYLGQDPVSILFMLVWHVRVLVLMKECATQKLSPVEIAKKTNEKPFTISKGLQQSRAFTAEQLHTMHSALLKMDIAMKSGTIKITTGDTTALRLELEQFIVKSCR